MALLWSEGFGAYGGSVASMLAGSWAEVGSPFTLSTAVKRTGAYALSLANASGSPARKTFGGSKGTVGVGFALYLTALPTFSDRLQFSFRDQANAEQVRVVVQPTGDLAVIRGSTTLGATTVPPLAAQSWNHVEIKVVCHDTTGAVEVRVNQVTVLNLTGVDTKNTAIAGVDQFAFNPNSAISVTAYFDDLFAWDTLGVGPVDFIGDKKVIEDFADEDGAEQEWTRSTGTASWALVDDAPPNDDADYISAVASGATVALKFPDLPSELSSVIAVSFEHYSRKTDAGPANLTGKVRAGGSTGTGGDTPITTAYTRRWDNFTADPSTGAPFTPAAASTAEYLLTRSL